MLSNPRLELGEGGARPPAGEVHVEVRRAAQLQLRGSIEAVTLLGPDDEVLEVVGRDATP